LKVVVVPFLCSCWQSKCTENKNQKEKLLH
jgi:hypothetical protein